MSTRLEDILPEYQGLLDKDAQEAALQIAAEALNAVSRDPEIEEKKLDRNLLSRVVVEKAKDWVSDTVSTRVLDQAVKKGHIQDAKPEKVERIGAQVRAGFRGIPLTFDPAFPEVHAEVPAWGWALCAVVGAVLGVLLIPRLTWLTWGNIEVGKILAGPAGAGAYVLIAAWAYKSRKRMLVLIGLTVVAGIGWWVIGRLWRKRDRSLRGVAKFLGWTLLAVLPLILVRPRKRLARSLLVLHLRPQVNALLSRWLDIIVALVWCHPDARVPEPPGPSEDLRSLFVRLAPSLTLLRRAVENGEAPLYEDAACQTWQDLGTWGLERKVLPEGHIWCKDDGELFETYGIVEEGQAVETLQAAWIKDGKALVKGQVQRLR